jgi:NAD(P)H-nitrite reductase large subunit
MSAAARRYVAVGSGPAVVRAFEMVRARDAGASLTVVGREPEGYYSRPGLAYYLADEITERGLFPLDGQALAGVGADYVQGVAERVLPSEHEVVLQDGRRVPYDRLLLATGSRAIMPGVEGVELGGVVKLDNLEDARNIIARGRRARAAVVVGGGITALEMVEGLASRKVTVHYFMRRDRYWSNVLAEDESRLVEERLRRSGVVVHFFTDLARIHGAGGEVIGVETAIGEVIPCQMVGLAIGVTPRKELAEGAGLQCGRGVLVDDSLRSSAPDIFVAGDLAETLDPDSGRRTLEVLWSSAVEKGQVAGANMAVAAGEPSPHVYLKGAALNVTRLAGFRVTIMGRVGSGEDADVKGVVRGDSESWSRLGAALPVVFRSKESHVRLMLGDDSIVGAVVLGDQELSFPLQQLIGSRAPLGATRDALAAPGADLGRLIEGLLR